MPTALEGLQHMGHCRGREVIYTRLSEAIPKALKYSGKVRVEETVQLCMTLGNLGLLWVLSFSL